MTIPTNPRTQGSLPVKCAKCGELHYFTYNSLAEKARLEEQLKGWVCKKCGKTETDHKERCLESRVILLRQRVALNHLR